MATINETIAKEIDIAIGKAARKIYHKNFKLSSNDVADLMDDYLQKISNGQVDNGTKNKKETLAHLLVYNAVSEIDNVKTKKWNNLLERAKVKK